MRKSATERLQILCQLGKEKKVSFNHILEFEGSKKLFVDLLVAVQFEDPKVLERTDRERMAMYWDLREAVVNGMFN